MFTSVTLDQGGSMPGNRRQQMATAHCDGCGYSVELDVDLHFVAHRETGVPIPWQQLLRLGATERCLGSGTRMLDPGGGSVAATSAGLPGLGKRR